MKNMTRIALFAISSIATGVHADEHHGGGGHFAPPMRGPAPHGAPVGPPRGAMQHPVQVAPPPPHGAPPRAVAPRGVVVPPPPHVFERPHVEHGEHWRGHESGPSDTRYRVERPFASGRFRGSIGHEHLYRVHRWDPHAHRFWLNGGFFVVAPWDLAYVYDWEWGDDEIVLYDDPDHVGWYVAYNARTGNYVHVEFGGEGD